MFSSKIERGFLSVLTSLLLFIAVDSYSQWVQLPSPFVGKKTSSSIHYKDGILWLGSNELFSSSDLGVSWTKMAIGPFSASEYIISINFYDRYIGLVSVVGRGLHFTNDGGISWKLINNNDYIVQAEFNKFPNVINAFQSTGGKFLRSTNSGVTWNESNIGTIGLSFTIAKNRFIYAFSYDFNFTNDIGFVYLSTDLGLTWSKQNQVFDPDCWSIVADSCDPARLYLLNEENLLIQDGISQIFVSTNSGVSWQQKYSHTSKYLTGALVNSGSALFASTESSESLRSTDFGETWIPYPAYSGSPDSRDITCVDNNLVFAVDSTGNIWKTNNAGGDSVKNSLSLGTISIQPGSLFRNDTIYRCNTEIVQTITILKGGCQDIRIKSERIVGDGRNNYVILNGAPSVISQSASVTIRFMPVSPDSSNAVYELQLANGSILFVYLYGVVKESIQLSASSSSIEADTLGGSVQIPIFLNGLIDKKDIELVLHYDDGLDYEGSFSPTGVRLDINGEQWKGRSKLYIPNAMSTSQLGYASFTVFADSSKLQKVIFDSLTVLNTESPCEYLLPPPVVSTVTPPSGCGVQTISNFIRYGEIPNIRLFPNPANNKISLVSSVNMQEVELSLVDMIGVQKQVFSVSLQSEVPYTIDLSTLPNGVYVISVATSTSSQRIPFVLSR